MDLIGDQWLCGLDGAGEVRAFSALALGDTQWRDLGAPRADFRGALYQFLVGLLQLAYAPQDVQAWRERYVRPPEPAELEAAFAPYRHAFLLEQEGPAFLQDLALPDGANRLPVLELLIDAGSGSNLYFNKPQQHHGLCEHCAAQALLTLQLNAPSGGRGVRTSLRGGGPLTTLLQPASETATLWQRLWLNVLPMDTLDHPPVKHLSDVLPWLAPTRVSDDKQGLETPPETVHPLQAYWSMPRRIRLVATTAGHGDCAVCGATDVRLFRHYDTRHGGTNYTGNWMHPLTPYYLDAKGEKPPISCKGHQAGRGYRDWLGLVLSNEAQQPGAARVVSHFTAKIMGIPARLWCFGYSMANMKALCWYDSRLPVHAVPADVLLAFTATVKTVLDSAESMAGALSKNVKEATLRADSAVAQSFWQRSEPAFYRSLRALAILDFDTDEELALPYRGWLRDTRQQVLALFDEWVLSIPLEDQDMARVVRARANLNKELNSGAKLKPLWDIVNRDHKEPA